GYLSFKDSEAKSKSVITAKYLKRLEDLEKELYDNKRKVKKCMTDIEQHNNYWRLINDAADSGYEIIYEPNIGIKMVFEDVIASDVKGNRPDIELGTIAVAVLPMENRILFLEHEDSFVHVTQYCNSAVHPH